MKITHLNKDGNANMVDVSDKTETIRIATAQTTMVFNKETYEVLKKGYVKKGDMLINLAAMPVADKGMVNTLRVSEIE